jgi:2,5-diketo-D-gluconate reductase B
VTSVYFEKGFERGFGTFPLKGDDCTRAVAAALEVGYRAFDTAQMYENEAEVGAALAASGLPRDQLLVTTKVKPGNFGEADFLPSVERSLEALRLDRIDVLLLHWPPEGGDIAPSLRLLSEARARGLTTHVGVSNYTVAMLRACRDIIADPIAINQVEFHPLLNQTRLLAGASEASVPLAAYCAVARGRVIENATLQEIGAAYGKSAAQIAQRWILQKGVTVNAMSTKPANIRANFEIMDFTLSSVDMARIDSLGSADGRIVTSAIVPWAPDWD